jgi:DNA-directed RNA polymerase subunit beta
LNEFAYYSAEEEEGKLIAQANASLNDDGTFEHDSIKARLEADYPLSSQRILQ